MLISGFLLTVPPFISRGVGLIAISGSNPPAHQEHAPSFQTLSTMGCICAFALKTASALEAIRQPSFPRISLRIPTTVSILTVAVGHCAD